MRLSRAGAFASGVRNAFSLPAWIVAFSFLGVGSLARDAAYPIGAALLSTVLVWAAPAQLILFGTLANGGLILPAAIAVGLSAIRLLPMTMAVLPYLRRPGQGFVSQALAAHLIAATTWMDAIRNLPGLPGGRRSPYFFGFSLSCLTLSFVMTGVGFWLVDALPAALATGLLCLTPIYFTISLTASAVRLSDWLAIALGLGLAPVAQWVVGRDFDLLATGLVAGTAAYLYDRRLRHAEAIAG